MIGANQLSKNKEPLVSVIISSYNHQEFINDAIESVLKQTYKNIELLVIDDGSTDRTPDILLELSRQHEFSFHARENRGLTHTYNELIYHSKGEYICTLGSDDIFMLDKVEKQVAFLEENPAYGVCGGNFIAIDENNNVLGKQKIRAARDLAFDDIFLGTKPGIPAGSAMVRKTAFPDPPYNPDIALEDLYLWLTLAKAGTKIHVLNDVLYYYRKHPSNAYKNLDSMYTNIMKIYDAFQSEEGYLDVVDNFTVSIALRAAKNGNRALARELLSKTPKKTFNNKKLKAYALAYRPW